MIVLMVKKKNSSGGMEVTTTVWVVVMIMVIAMMALPANHLDSHKGMSRTLLWTCCCCWTLTCISCHDSFGGSLLRMLRRPLTFVQCYKKTRLDCIRLLSI